MWDIDNSTDYAAAAKWTRDKDGVHRWLVAVKATFDLTGRGEVSLAETQPEPVLVPIFRGDPAKSSLLLDSDLLAERPGTDVLLDACAFAPNGRPTEQVEVSMQVASVHKRLLVYGPRTYERGLTGLTTSEPLPFSMQPIHYEWAFGGSDLAHPDVSMRCMDLRNPVGKGVVANVSDLYGQPAHSIEYPDGDPSRMGPAGFGPIPGFWSPRRERAGTYDARWEQSQKPLLPADYDERYAMSAPEDQWSATPLVGGEWVSLTNLCADGFLRFQLPRIDFTFQTWFGTRSCEHPGRLSAVIVSPHLRRFSMVWQSSLRVPLRETDYLDYTSISTET